MKADGACHCGAIAFEAEIDPEQVLMCHCTDCQTMTGTAFRTLVLVSEEKFRLLKGVPKIYLKTAESGRQRVLTFCPECGSPIYSTGGNSPRVLAVRIGSLRQRAELVPKRQIWCKSALPWLPKMEDIERVECQ